jgi:hypothetical protein
MMVDKETADAPGILQLISRLSTEGLSGRLDIVAGATDGVIFFKDGKLLDARIGHLTGFQAMNAVAAMRDARYHFDPTARIPRSSSITPSERLVLKQFFGIETVDPHAMPAMVDEYDEATVVTSHVPSTPVETVAPPHHARSATPYLIAFAVSVLVVALAAAAVFLRSKFRERTEQASVATSSQPSEPVSRPVPAEPTVDKQPVATATDSRTIATDRRTSPATDSTTPTATDSTTTTSTDSRTTTATDSTSTTAPDLSGKWNVVNTVNTTAHRGFQNLQVGFALSINQTGKTFTAKGQKVSENGRSLPASSRTPIQLKGFIDGDRVEATFSEQGTVRKTNGRFVWKLDPAGGGLRGTFASTAAQSSGRSTARREL